MLKNFTVTPDFSSVTAAKTILRAAFKAPVAKGAATEAPSGPYWPFPSDWGDDEEDC